MKSAKQAIALFLTLAMLLSCTVCAASAVDLQKPETEAEAAQDSGLNKGVFSPEFQATKAQDYTPEEIVRAIILLEGEPLADDEDSEEKRSAYGLKIAKEHTRVQSAMTEYGIPFELGYEYDTLLNGFSCDVSYGDLEKIAGISGVSSVHIASTVETPASEETRNVISNQTTGNQTSHLNGFTGEGIVIAVIDTGFNVNHKAFQVYDNMPITPVLSKEDISKASVLGEYVSEKIPFSYNYADKGTDVSAVPGHGTMSASIAAGYGENENGEITYCGSAPAAQLVLMAVDGTGGTTSGDAYLCAFEDAYSLGVDVINYSKTSIAGFTEDVSELWNVIFERLSDAGIILCTSAGNDYSVAHYAQSGVVGTEYLDYGVVGSPASIDNDSILSVAATNNTSYLEYTITVEGTEIAIYDHPGGSDMDWGKNFAGKSVEFVVLKNADGTDLAYGAHEDYKGINVKDKIVVISYGGDLKNWERMQYATAAGAAGLLVCNQEGKLETLGLESRAYGRPAATLTSSAREIFLNAKEGGQLYTSAEKKYVDSPFEEPMSDFSSWGPTPMLTIAPVLSSVGHQILTADYLDDSGYVLGSGTSSSSPNLAGTLACVLQGIQEMDEDQAMTKTQRRDLAIALLESTAVIQGNGKNGFASVRQQGAGLANSLNALSVYKNAAYLVNPIQELGDDKDKTGLYTMELTLANEGTEPVVYDKLQSYVLYDLVEETSPGVYINKQESGFLFDGQQGDAEVSYSVNGESVTQVVVEGGQSLNVEVTVALTDKAKEFFDVHYPNGAFVEGYIGFGSSAPEGCEVHGTFLAFYGDWNQAPALEELNSFDYLETSYEVYSAEGAEDLTEAGADEAIREALMEQTFLYTEINQVFVRKPDGSRGDYLGLNPLDSKAVRFMPEHVSFATPSTNGSKYSSIGLELDLYLLRNARHVTMTVTDKYTGEVYFTENKEYVRKAFTNNKDQTNRSCTFMWKGIKPGGGAYLPSGTEVVVSIDVQLPYGEAENIWQRNAWQFDVTVDYTAPTIESVVYDEVGKTLTVRAKDENYLAGIYLCSPDHATVFDQKTFSSKTKGASFEAVFDVDQMPLNQIQVVAVDYATNEVAQDSCFVEEGLPANVVFSSPAGENVVSALTGDAFTFPEAEAYEGYIFLGWADQEVRKSGEQGLPYIYTAGETGTIKICETVFYAMYAKGEILESVFVMEQSEDFTGQFALVGFPNDNKPLGTAPVAMDSATQSVQIADLENSVILPEKQAFITSDSGIIYEIEEYAGAGTYTLKNKATNEYLLCQDGQMYMRPTLYVPSLWRLSCDPESGGLRLINNMNPDSILLFNYETGAFEIFDDSLSDGEQKFSLYLYRRYDKKLVAEYYTTQPCFYDNGGDHSLCYTDQGETHSASCVCGYSITEEHSYVSGRCLCGSLNIAVSHTLDLASDISINYVVPKKQLQDFDRFYLECKIPVYKGNELIGSNTVFVEPTERNSVYYFTLRNISAVQMNDLVDAQLHLFEGDTERLFQVEPYSIGSYAYYVLSTNHGNEQVNRICANLLRYGAKAQLFKNYRTDALADAGMTEDQKAYLTDLSSVSFGNMKQEEMDCGNPLATWSGISLDLQSKVALKFVVNCSNCLDDLDKLVLHVTYTNIQGDLITVQLTNPVVYSEAENLYSFAFQELLAPELRTAITAAVYLDNKQISNTICYSADTYGNNKTGNLLVVCQALFAYSDSAKAYFGS